MPGSTTYLISPLLELRLEQLRLLINVLLGLLVIHSHEAITDHELCFVVLHGQLHLLTCVVKVHQPLFQIRHGVSGLVVQVVDDSELADQFLVGLGHLNIAFVLPVQS